MTVITTRGITQRSRVVLLALLCLTPIGALAYGFSQFSSGNYAACIGFSGFFTLFLLSAVHGLLNWDAERSRVLLAAFAWGAGVATLGALAIEYPIDTSGITHAHTITLTLVAPVIEEIMKDLGIVAILVALRGKANAFLIALVIGLGFATFENTEYLAQELTNGGWTHSFFAFIISRCFTGTLIHAVLAGFVGLVIQHRKRLIGYLPLILLGTMFVHAICNGLFGIITNAYTEIAFITVFAIILIAFNRKVNGTVGGQEQIQPRDDEGR